MCVARNILKNPKLLPGGGATELTVSATLKQKSSSVEGVEKVLFHFSLRSLLMIRAFIGMLSANE
jgi:chaperonin GroEL (HSP60 family)